MSTCRSPERNQEVLWTWHSFLAVVCCLVEYHSVVQPCSLCDSSFSSSAELKYDHVPGKWGTTAQVGLLPPYDHVYRLLDGLLATIVLLVYMISARSFAPDGAKQGTATGVKGQVGCRCS